MREVTIDTIGVSSINNHPILLLKEKTEERYLPMWISSANARAIQGETAPRPLSHDLLWSVIRTLGADAHSVIINDIIDDSLCANIVFNTREGQKKVDAHPGDALALAVKAQIPIFVEDTVLDRASILINKETGRAVSQETSQRKDVTKEELKGMSAFTDFIGTLNMDDLGEERQERG
jgi:bifunctional DNase/RNase